MIEKIGNIYYDKWKSGFDGNICGTKGIYPTITTRYEAIGPTNILTLAHYPMTVILYEFE